MNILINSAITQALDDLLRIAGEEAQFITEDEEPSPLQVIMGNKSSLSQYGNFQTRDYEYHFLCKAVEVQDRYIDSEITLNGQSFSILHIDVQGPAAILYGE